MHPQPASATALLPPLTAVVPAQRGPLDDVAQPPPPAPRPQRRRRRWLLLVLALLLPVLPSSAGPEPTVPASVRAYFLGDSIMSGTGASPRRPVMARIAAARLGWQVEVDAWGGTGYTTAGRSPGYLERLRLPGALAGRYDVVLLEGGTNDAHAGSTPAQVRAAVREVVREVQRRQPQARVVLMGAYDPPGVLDLRRGVADGAVRDVAHELGLAFFSAWSGRWTTGHDPGPFLDDDGLHPTAQGYGVLGERLAAALAAALPDLDSGAQPPASSAV